MNRRNDKKAVDELIIVRLRCKFLIKCGKCCNRGAMDIAIKEDDLVLEEHCDDNIHFKNTLLNILKRLKINQEKIFCDKHKGATDEISNYAVNITIPNSNADKNIC